jgi:thymidylate synthase
MNTLDKQYQTLLQSILDFGVDKEDRTGTGTRSIFGYTIRHNLNDGFPLLTTKKMAIKSVMTELKWFLKGRTDIQYLRDNGCKIWDGDFEKAGKADGTLGPIYGKQWRDWTTQKFNVERGEGYLLQIDQIAKLLVELKNNPDSRRLMVSAWNVGELDEMSLPPCHYGFQVYTRLLDLDERIAYYNKNNVPLGKSSDYFHEHMDDLGVPRRVISLMWNQRSVDTFLGLPFNIASYAMLLHLIAKTVDMVPGEVIGNLGDVHLYSNHIEQAEEQISREPFEHLPKLKLGNVDILNGEFDYEILHYQSHPTIKAPLSN